MWNGSIRVQVEKTVNRGNEDEVLNGEGLEMVNREVSETPRRKRCRVEGAEIDDANMSPESKRLMDMQKGYAKLLECRRVERALRENYNIH